MKRARITAVDETHLNPGDPFLTLESFKILLQHFGVAFNPRKFTIWLRYPRSALPCPFQAVLTNAPEQWYVALHGAGGWSGEHGVIPLRYLSQTYAQYADNHQLITIYKEHQLSIQAALRALRHRHPALSGNALYHSLRKQGHKIRRSVFFQLLTSANSLPPLHRTRTSRRIVHLKTTLVLDEHVMARLQDEAARKGSTISGIIQAQLDISHNGLPRHTPSGTNHPIPPHFTITNIRRTTL